MGIQIQTEIVQGQKNRALVVQLMGELDAYSVENLEKFFQEYEPDNIDTVVLDFTHLDFVSSTGIGMIVSLKENLLKENINLKLIHVQNQILKIFEIVGLDQVFTFHSSLEEAIQ